MQIVVLLAAFNGEKYIEEQLRSLEKQTFRDFFCYIHDDGSSDKTPQIAEDFCLDHADRFSMLHYPGTGGASENFLSMLKEVDAPYVMFCDQDDIWLENKIELTLSAMLKEEMEHPNLPVLVCTDSIITAEDTTVISRSFLRYSGYYRNSSGLPVSLFSDNNAQGATIMMNRALCGIIKRCGFPKEINMYDHWCALVAEATGIAKCIDTPTMLYRQHKGQTVGAEPVMKACFAERGARWIFGTLKKEKIQQMSDTISVAQRIMTLPNLPEESFVFLTELLNTAGTSFFSALRFLNRNCAPLPNTTKWKQAYLLHLTEKISGH